MNPTERSIFEQFGYWRRVPHPALEGRAPVAVLGCGSSFHLSQAIACAFNRHGRAAMAVPAGEWTRRRAAYLPSGQGVHAIALSRSGETTETIQAMAASRAAGEPVTAITCAAASAFGREPGAIVLDTHPDEGIVMTVSASLLLLIGLRLAGVAVGEATVAAAEALLAEVRPALPELVAGVRHVVFLGGGGLHGIAQEGAIKLQEMSQSFAHAYHPLEYRHGPISLVDRHTLAVALFDEDARLEELRIVADIREKGGRVLGLGGPGDAHFVPGGEPGARGLVCLPVIQALGEAMAQAKGLDTAAPRHLNKVVVLAGG